MTQKPVVILGGGLAGLTAAGYLHQNGVNVRLYEAGPKLAGLAQSFHDKDGFTYDFGAHFITNCLADAIGIGGECRNVPRYGETVWLNGRTYGYPFGLMRVPRFLGSAFAMRVRGLRGGSPIQSAADWFRAKYGRALADEVAIPLTEAWSGAPAAELSPAVGDSIPGSILRTLYLSVCRVVTGRMIAIGYSREMPENRQVWHVYPLGGVSALCQRLAEDASGAIHLDSPVEAIYVEENRVVGVRVGGRDEDASAVVSTAPCHILAKLVRGTDALNYLSRFRYRPMVFVNLRFQGRKLLPDVVTWTPEKELPFFRLTETPCSMPWLAPEGKTIITADIGCQVGDTNWSMTDDQMGEHCLEGLTRLIPDARQRYLGCRVLRTQIAYPVFLNEYEQDRKQFEQGTGIAGLSSIGRNGEFSHMFMEDVYFRTRKKMHGLLSKLNGCAPASPIGAGC